MPDNRSIVFSDLDFALEDVFGEGDRVCWRFSLRARHTGPFMGLPPTGKTITLTGLSIGRLADGKLVEAWGEQDMGRRNCPTRWPTAICRMARPKRSSSLTGRRPKGAAAIPNINTVRV